MSLEQEQETYLREKSKLLAEGNGGKFALIFGDKVDSVWHCQLDATKMGYDKFWPKPFMVHLIAETEVIQTL